MVTAAIQVPENYGKDGVCIALRKDREERKEYLVLIDFNSAVQV